MQRMSYLSGMKLKWIIVFLFLLAGGFAVSAYKAEEKRKGPEEPGFVFIELFTSEGCSSCPPADQLVEKITAENGNRRIYIASYHVDYWDRLGWKDRFSNQDYSAIQSRYAKQFKLTTIYTPQMVVNGQTEFIGSNEIKLRNVITTNLKAKDKVQLEISQLAGSGDLHNFRYQVSNADTAAQLTFLVVQKKAVVAIRAEENYGRTMSHTNVVRDRRELPAGKLSGEYAIRFPKDLEAGNWEVFCFVKNRNTGEVLSARSLTL